MRRDRERLKRIWINAVSGGKHSATYRSWRPSPPAREVDNPGLRKVLQVLAVGFFPTGKYSRAASKTAPDVMSAPSRSRSVIPQESARSSSGSQAAIFCVAKSTLYDTLEKRYMLKESGARMKVKGGKNSPLHASVATPSAQPSTAILIASS